MGGTSQFPDRNKRAGAAVTRTGVLLIAARHGADALKVSTSVYSYTTT